jgi:hypothetical protein
MQAPKVEGSRGRIQLESHDIKVGAGIGPGSTIFLLCPAGIRDFEFNRFAHVIDGGTTGEPKREVDVVRIPSTK